MLDDKQRKLVDKLKQEIYQYRKELGTVGCKAMIYHDIRTVAILAQKYPGEILKMRNFGKKCYARAEQLLHSFGLEFGMEFDAEVLAEVDRIIIAKEKERLAVTILDSVLDWARNNPGVPAWYAYRVVQNREKHKDEITALTENIYEIINPRKTTKTRRV